MKPIGAYVDFTQTADERFAWWPVRCEDQWVWLDRYIVVYRRAQLPGRAETEVKFTRRISKHQWMLERLRG